MFLADKHNFGSQVHKLQRGSETWYQKPRTVYWEWLFFGKSSPLKEIFNEKGENGLRPLADYFFNLDVEIENNWKGLSREIVAENSALTLEHFYAFGALLGYCYVFGIRDLHKQNLVLTNTHLQVVDVEVVFTDLILPNETLLLPFKNIGYEFAGIGALVDAQESLSKTQVEQILLGYWDLVSLIAAKRTEIENSLSELDFSKIPVRVIVRNTSEYGNISGQQNILPSELEQLNREDVPYYFKFIADKNLYWLKEKNLQQQESSVGIFARDIDRHADYEPGKFLSLDRISKMRVHGLLFCLKKFGFYLNLRLSHEAALEGQSLVVGEEVFVY